MNPVFKTIVLAVAVLVCAGTALGQSDKIAVYADESASSCNLVDIGTQVHQLFVVFTGTTGVTAAEFQLVPEGGAALTFLGQTIPEFAAGAMGRADTGIGIALGGCYDSGTVTLLKVIYQGLGVSGECSQLHIGPDPRFPRHVNDDKILFISCGEQKVWADSGHLTVNPDDDCECETEPDDLPSPVIISTWGGIKALYVD
jgi:hypothetical protein